MLGASKGYVHLVENVHFCISFALLQALAEFRERRVQLIAGDGQYRRQFHLLFAFFFEELFQLIQFVRFYPFDNVSIYLPIAERNDNTLKFKSLRLVYCHYLDGIDAARRRHCPPIPYLVPPLQEEVYVRPESLHIVGYQVLECQHKCHFFVERLLSHKVLEYPVDYHVEGHRLVAFDYLTQVDIACVVERFLERSCRIAFREQ